jgi:hypothetical protein
MIGFCVHRRLIGVLLHGHVHDMVVGGDVKDLTDVCGIAWLYPGEAQVQVHGLHQRCAQTQQAVPQATVELVTSIS